MLEHIMRWLRARPLVADGLLAGLLTVVSVVALASTWSECEGDCDPGGVAAGLVLATTVPLVWRRRHPLAVSLVTGMATAAYGFAHYPDLAMPIAIGGVVGMYSVAAWGSRRAALLAGGVAVVVVVVVMSLPRADADVVDAAFVSLSLAGAWVLGDRARVQWALAAELRERAVRLERERAEEARRAVATERARIARELHDVVARHVSMMVVQAEAGPVVVEATRPGPPARSRRSPPPAARPWSRCAGSSGCCAATATGTATPRPASPPSPAWPRCRPWSSRSGGPGSGSSWWSRAPRRRCRPGSTCPPTGSSRRR